MIFATAKLRYLFEWEISMKLLTISAFATATLLIAATAQAAASDNFNRQDSSSLGSNWTLQSGTVGISNNEAFGTDWSYATYNGASSSFVSFDVSLAGAGTSYVAGLLGLGGVDNAFVKVQQNGDLTGFDNYAFYDGNNRDGLFAPLSTAFDSAHIEITLVGSIATLTITPNVGGVQVYTHTYGFSSTGTGVGLGFNGTGRADNFDTAVRSVPEPATWGLMIVGFGLVGVAARRRSVAVAA